ncbi:hypothetical protein AL755_03755 (plasmid) [Arthrobacter sp. ERGS1:01]|nr:hypothetical protein AL755_03755 [Arthrobacter sp. ERGS1:01]
MPWTLLVLGELNPDVLLDSDGGPVAFGQVETELRDAAVTLGSSGAITAAAAAALGLPVAMCAVLGDDELGSFTLGLLERTGVDAGAVIRRKNRATGLTVVINVPGGDRALLTFPGTMAELRVADIPAELLTDARHVHVSSIFLQRALLPELATLFAELRARGVTTSLDTGWDPRQDWGGIADALENTSYIFPNEAELGGIAQRLGIAHHQDTPHWYVGAARALSALGPTVVLKRGGHGGLVCSKDTGLQLDTEPATPFDTTGAGDNFNAGFLHGVSRGAPLAECLASAVAAGTVSIQGRGGTGSLATPAELQERIAGSFPHVRVLW